jgi:hypothetical protein
VYKTLSSEVIRYERSVTIVDESLSKGGVRISAKVKDSLKEAVSKLDL